MADEVVNDCFWLRSAYFARDPGSDLPQDIPPLGLLSELRLGLARYRLGSTAETLAQVAAAVGYDSESAFARAFRKRYRISPGRFRARHEGRSRVNDIQSASDAQT